jgi:hypothetical protein
MGRTHRAKQGGRCTLYKVRTNRLARAVCAYSTSDSWSHLIQEELLLTTQTQGHEQTLVWSRTKRECGEYENHMVSSLTHGAHHTTGGYTHVCCTYSTLTHGATSREEFYWRHRLKTTIRHDVWSGQENVRWVREPRGIKSHTRRTSHYRWIYARKQNGKGVRGVTEANAFITIFWL